MKKYLLAGMIGLMATPLQAQLPEAKDLVSKYAAAVGADALMKYASVRSTGTFSMPGAGMNGTIEMMRAQPDRMFMRVTLPGLGDVTRGFDGTIGWSNNPMEGARVLTGAEAAQIQEESALAATVRAPSFFKALETVEKTTMSGRECYKVKLTWASGRVTHDCYAVDDGLLIGTQTSQATPQGDVDVTTTIGDYRKFGAVLMPTRLSQTVMGQEQIVVIDSVEFDKVAAGAFEPPAAIKSKITVQ